MPVVAVIGAQWGDEGKGHIVDMLAERARLVIRYGGGNNAGHTVVNRHGTFKLHIVPSGVFDPAIVNIIGSGVVVDPAILLEEIANLDARGISTAKLFVSDRAHVIMPYTCSRTGSMSRFAVRRKSAQPGAGLVLPMPTK